MEHLDKTPAIDTFGFTVTVGRCEGTFLTSETSEGKMQPKTPLVVVGFRN